MYKLMFYIVNDLFLTDPGIFPFIDPDQEPPLINPIVPTIAVIVVIAAAVPMMQAMMVPPPTATTTISTTATVAPTTTTTVTAPIGTHLVCLCQANLLAWDSFLIDIFSIAYRPGRQQDEKHKKIT